MEDLQKEFVPYDFAIRMKQLGFNESRLLCFGAYLGVNLEFELYDKPKYINFGTKGSACSAPTLSQAFRWFRGKNYQAEILWRGDFGDFCWKIGKFKYGSHFFSDNGFKTYEEAELACIEKLLEIVEQKQK